MHHCPQAAGRLGTICSRLREISGGSGYGSQNASYAYFGLGAATNIDVDRVEWPSGTLQELHSIPSGQLLTVVEPAVSISQGAATLNRGEMAVFTAIVLRTNQQFIYTSPAGNATFQVALTGAPPVHLQWRHDQQLIPNATNARDSVPVMPGVQSQMYWLHPRTGL